MTEILEFAGRHAALVLFAWVLVDQGGIPLPAVPILLVAGGLAGAGRASAAGALAAVVAGCVAADLLWYTFGRLRGARVLGLLCRITLEPDSCVRNVEEQFVSHRLRLLLIAKFLPGLNPVTAALSGVVKVRLGRFVVYATASGFAWAVVWMGLGYMFSDLIEEVTAQAARLGHGSILAVLGVLGGYVGIKYLQRHRFLRALRTARIGADELKRRLDEGQETLIVDLRTRLDVQAMPYAIPGARWIDRDDLERRHAEIPRDAEIVLYCT